MKYQVLQQCWQCINGCVASETVIGKAVSNTTLPCNKESPCKIFLSSHELCQNWLDGGQWTVDSGTFKEAAGLTNGFFASCNPPSSLLETP